MLITEESGRAGPASVLVQPGGGEGWGRLEEPGQRVEGDLVHRVPGGRGEVHVLRGRGAVVSSNGGTRRGVHTVTTH